MGKKLSYEDFVKRSKIIHNNKYNYSKVEYVNNSTKVCIICPEHGEFQQTPNKHLQGQGCPKCGKINGNIKKCLTQDEFEKKANNVHNSKYQYSNDYKNGSTKIKIICPIHGEFWQTPNHHLNGEGCPKCAIEKNTIRQKMSLNDFIKISNTIHNNKYKYNNASYVNYKTDLCIICPEHGEFWQSPDSHLHNHGCPKCGNQISNCEDEICTFLKNECDLEVKTRCKDIIAPYELDVYIPDNKVAIEYDGLIWHSEKFGKDKNYHLMKTKLCEKQGIRLIHIFEDEWLENKEIVKTKLKHILKCNNDLQKVFARKCSVNEINHKQAREFLETNHIQGGCNSTVYLGCFYENELVGVMSFKRETKNSDKWELTRFATDINKHCVGVGGKLFTYFLKNYNPSEVKSFADRRWSINNDNLYIKLGFKLDKVLKPDYSYVLNKKRLHKFSCRKNKLIFRYHNEKLNINLTENEMTEKLGLYKIWNCGLLRYIWK